METVLSDPPNFVVVLFRPLEHDRDHLIQPILIFVAWSAYMPRSHWTPSIVPNEDDQTVYLVAEDFGRLGRSWREAEYDATDLETVLQDLLAGEYRNPFKVVAFNTAERWSEDVSEDVARELRRRCDMQMCDLPSSIADFVERYEIRDWHQLTLRLV